MSLGALMLNRKVSALDLHPQRAKVTSSSPYFQGNICAMTLTAFLAYLFKFLSNPALLSALLAFIQKILR